jgi:hypothetical protein
MVSVCRPWFRFPVRNLGVGLALVAYLAASLGFALPIPTRKPRGQPFPCQDHACGCRSAEECWRHCCCFSPTERLAWSQAQGIDPPAYAEKPPTGGWRNLPIREQAGPSSVKKSCGGSCCSPGEVPANSPSAGPGWCGGTACSNPPTEQRPLNRSGISPLRCQGLATTWISLGTVPPTPPLEWFLLLSFREKLAHLDLLAGTVPLPPPEHPPRSFRA